MIKSTDIAWLAGLLEGEGCFSLQGKDTPTKYMVPAIRINMKDVDIINRVGRLLDRSTYFAGSPVYAKQQYAVCITGRPAVEWMMTVYGLMGHRRKVRILEILNYWKVSRYQPPRKGYHKTRAYSDSSYFDNLEKQLGS